MRHEPTPRRAFSSTFTAALLLMLALLLTACGGNGTVKPRLFPPSASIQELRRSGDEQWTLVLRLQNFSNVGMRIQHVDAQLRIADGASMSLQASPGLTIAPNSAEPYPLGFQLSAEAARRVTDALSNGRSVSYSLKGHIHSSEPKNRNDEFEFESSLTPVPGLPDTLR